MGLKDSTMDASLIKTQWKDKGSVYQMVHLDIEPVSAYIQLLEQLKGSGFKIREHYDNLENTYRLFAKICIRQPCINLKVPYCCYLSNYTC